MKQINSHAVILPLYPSTYLHAASYKKEIPSLLKGGALHLAFAKSHNYEKIYTHN
jgi:predicted nucleic acid-binding protein